MSHAASPSKLVELDTLRGLMAMWVCLDHAAFLSGLPSLHGQLAVSVFIVLSGFAITTSILARPTTYFNFISRRFFRIYPVYLIGLILGIFTSQHYSNLLHSLPWTDQVRAAEFVVWEQSERSMFWAHLVAHLTLSHGLIPNDLLPGAAFAFNAPGWSLSLEWQFYLVAPALVALVLRADAKPIVLASLMFVFLALNFVSEGRFPLVPSFLPQQIGLFFIGILTAIYLPRMGNRMLVCASVLLVSISAMYHALIVPAVAWSVVIIGPRLRPEIAVLFAPFRWRPLVAFGEASYGFYILHMPILIVVGWLFSDLDRPLFAASLLLVIPITTLLALASYKWLESPINGWAKRRFR